jgi:hypothetical protein
MAHLYKFIPTDDGNYEDPNTGELIFDEDGNLRINEETGLPYYQPHAEDDPEMEESAASTLEFTDVFRTDLRDAGGHQLVIAELSNLEGWYTTGGIPVNRRNFGFDSRLKYVTASQPFFTTPDFESKLTQFAFEWGINFYDDPDSENQLIFQSFKASNPEEAAYWESIWPYPWTGLIYQDAWQIQAQMLFSYVKWPMPPSHNSETPNAKAAYEAGYGIWYPASGWRVQVFVPEYEPVYDENDPDGDPIGSRKLGTFTELPHGTPMQFFKNFPVHVMAIGA